MSNLGHEHKFQKHDGVYIATGNGEYYSSVISLKAFVYRSGTS